MKAKVKATELKRALSAVLALQKLTTTKVKAAEAAETSGLKGRLLVTTDGKLLVESSNMGAYVCVSIEATTLRPGKVGIEMSALEKIRVTGLVTVGIDDKTGMLRIHGSRSDYNLALDQDADALVSATVPDQAGIRFVAKVPTSILATAAAMVAIKPALKAESMRMQFHFSKGPNGGRLEIVGLDFYSYGRFIRDAPDINVREDTKFVLRATSLSTILKNIAGDEVMIGVQQAADNNETTLVRFKSEDADIVYPTIDLPFLNPSEVHQRITSGTFDGGFTALRSNVREALNTVKTIATGNVPLLLKIRILHNDVEMTAENNGNAAKAQLTAKDIKLPTEQPHTITVNQAYLNEVVSLAPDMVPMRVESWNQAQVIVHAERVDDGQIEYSISQVDSTKLSEERDD